MYIRAIFGGNWISDSEIETVFDSQIKSFDANRLIFWILGLCTPISNRIKKNWHQTLTTDLKEGGCDTSPPKKTQGIEKAHTNRVNEDPVIVELKLAGLNSFILLSYY